MTDRTLPNDFLKNCVFLLGAGASKDAGLPLANELFNQLIYEIENGYKCNTSIKLQWAEYIKKFYELLNHNFEKTIAVIKYLSLSQTERASIFVAVNFLSNFEKQEINGQSLDEFFKECWSFISRQFLQERLEVINKKQILYLENLMCLTATRSIPIPIFTLNYDDSIEKAAEEFGVKINLGFDNDLYKHAFEDLKESGIRLYKLHGSIHWKTKLLETGNYYEQISKGRVGMEIPCTIFDEPSIIMGDEKLEAKGYSLDMLFDFKAEINKTKNLCIIGYSFQDDHINKFLTEWYSKVGDQNVVIVDPNFDEKNHGVGVIAGGVIRSLSPNTAMNVFRNSDFNKSNLLFSCKMGFADFLKSWNVERKL